MEDLGMIVFAIIYMGVMFWIGWRFMNGRIKWCEEEGVPNRIVKIILSFVIGNILGAFIIGLKIVLWMIGNIFSNR